MVNLYQQTAAIFLCAFAERGCQSLFAQKGSAGRVAEVVFAGRRVAGFSIAKYIPRPQREFFHRLRSVISNNFNHF